MTSTRDLLLAVQSGKSTVIQATFDAVITEKTTAAIEAYREAVIDNTFNEVSESELDEVAYDSRTLDDKKKKQPVIARGVKGMKSTPFEKKFPSMAHYEKWADSEASGNHEVHDVRLHESTEEELEEDADESEEISELSKKTLRSYIKNAKSDIRAKNKIVKSVEKLGPDRATAYDFHNMQNAEYKVLDRKDGVSKATRRLTKESEDLDLSEYTLEEIQEFMESEDFASLDELSKKTLSSYVKKASVTAVTGKEASTAQASEMGRHLDKGDVKGATHFAKKANDLNTKVIKRVTGIAKAADKLAKE